MPISFEQINSIPDILPNNRHELRFPTISDSDGYQLTLRHGHVTLPQASIGQVQVKLLGHRVAFAGGMAHENSMTVTFLEDSAGTVLQALIAWMEIARNRNTGGGGLKSEYAANGTLYMHDTNGDKVHTFTLFNMWPMAVSYPDMGEESGPSEVEVTFSVDAVDLETSQGAYNQHQTGRKSLRGEGDAFAYPNADPASLDFGKSIANMSIDGSNFNVQKLLAIGPYQLSPEQSVLPNTAFTMAKFASQFGSLFR